jgi:RHS repeat-associated protein
MLSSWRFCSALLVCVVLGAVVAVTAAGSGGPEALNGVAGVWAPAPLLSGRLVVPGVQALDGGEQESDELVADRADPVAVAVRRRSRTQYERLGANAAARVIAQTAPVVLRSAPSGLQQAPAGARIARYLSSNSAQLDLPGGKHVLAESLAPLARRTPSGRFAPVDLALRTSGPSFVASSPAVPVSISRELAGGAKVGSSGLSLTPLGALGARLSAVGRLDGGAVVYPNTGVDADTAVKPTSSGVESYATLRSVDSPQRLYYRLGVPAGASLRSSGAGTIRVVKKGRTLAIVPAATATDAVGTPVPTVTRLSGKTLRVEVHHRSGDYRYPIVVDPTVIDTSLYYTYGSNWRLERNSENFRLETPEYKYLSIYIMSSVQPSQWGALLYPTQGESHIYELSMETSASTGSNVENHLAIIGAPSEGGIEKGGWEASVSLPKSYGRSSATACIGTCSSSNGSAANVAAYWINAISTGAGGEMIAYAASVYIAQTNGPSVSANATMEHNSSGERNVFYGSGGWMSPGHAMAAYNVSDPGIGVSEVQYTVGAKKWNWKAQCNTSVQCPEKTTLEVLATDGGGLPDGEPTIEAKALNDMGSSATTTAKVKVDSTAPHEIGLTGLPSEINDATPKLKLSGHATDGVTGTVSSGVASLKLAIDGSEVGSPNGACTPGPCTATGEWTISGEDYSAGKHTYVVTVADVAGNSATSEGSFTVHHAAPISIGPGEFNPVTGEFDLEEEDVSIAAPGAPLTITRSYISKEPSAGSAEAFGAPWTMSFGGAQKLVRGYHGNMTLVATSGAETTFYSLGAGAFESPPGDKTLTLTGGKSETEFTLTDNGSSVKFTHVSGDAESLYRASLASGTGGTHTTQFTYQSVGGVVEPLQELAPVPLGVSCAPTLKPGCRALTYNFATSTTATGESSSQWGDYAGRLTRVYLSTATEQAGGELWPWSTEVAHYLYDSKGRLRAEWDPRIYPALKTTYGYDSEGHMTAVTPPGKETWAFTYGTTSSDTSPGRLLKVYRPPASESLWGGEGPKSTVAPKLAGAAAVGVPVSTSDGTWSGTPISYGYQWQRCNSSGGECSPIGGAANAVYTPTSTDLGHTLVAQVTADNGGGAVTVSTSASGAVVSAASAGVAYSQSVDSGNSVNAVTCVPTTTDCVLSDSKGNALYSTNVSSGSSSTWTSWSGPGVSPSEALSCPTTTACVLVDGEKANGGGNLYYATTLGGAWTIAQSAPGGPISLACASSSWCLAGQGKGIVSYSSNPLSTSWTRKTLASTSMKSPFCLSSSFCAIGDGAGNVRVATSKTQVESTSWTTSSVDGENAINGMACFSTTSCVAVDAAGNVLNLTIASGGEASAAKQSVSSSASLAGLSCSGAVCVTVDNHGNIFASRDSGKTWALLYHAENALTAVSCASSSLCVAADNVGNEIAVDPELVSEHRSPQPGSTIEYGVPVSGSGAPYSMSSGDVAKWAQTDVPVEATAVFAIDEPQEWPSSDYRRATVDYLDANDRLVNVAQPGGAIVTSEYNSYNDVVRNLGADNRATALKEGAKSAEVSQTLDTQSTYGEEGSELLSVLAPLHTVKLASGATAQARKHTVYSYDEGAPSTGGPYRLVTKVTEGAQISGEAEADVRTTTTSYAGQNNLGWILRKPTAKRVDPSGLKLVYSTVYDPTTGNVTETRTPAAGAPGEEVLSGYVYRSSYGAGGSGNGQLSNPGAIAKDAEGNLWVADTANNRVEEFSSGGTYIQKFGTVGTGNGQLKSPKGIAVDSEGRVWVVDTGNNRIQLFSNTGTYLFQFGTLGSLESNSSFVYFKEPTGIAYLSKDNRMLVADTGNNRIQEFSANSEVRYQGKFGSNGSGNLQLNKPEGIAVDSSLPTHVWVADTGNNRVKEFDEWGGGYVTQFGLLGSGNGQLNKPKGVAIDSEGNVLVADGGNSRVQSFSSSGTYQFQFGTVGTGEKQMKAPAALTLDGSNDAYVLDTGNNRIEKWQPAGSYHESSGTGGTHGTQTIYYTAAANSEVTTCGKHAEWAGLPCEARPAAQPETSGVPNLPVTVVTYNEWEEPYETKETVGSTTRTTNNSYLGGGRLWGQQVTSSVGTSLPMQEFEYDGETGELKRQAPIEESTGPIEWTHNRLGELTSYKDADGNTSTYSYDAYGRLESVNDGKGTQTYSYDATTGLPTKLVDSAAGAFTAAYDVEGGLTTAGYPNGMNVNHSYDATGSEVGVEYVKTTHCTSACTWYSQSESPSIHGQALSQSSTLSSQTYTYDAAGRLTKAQDTAAGEGCTTRIYAYDQETNINSLTTRAPGGGGVCATEGGTALNHVYDTANRLTDTGIAYDTFGDITKLSAGDAGGTELASTYFVDETLATQTQNGQAIGYHLDPEGRNRQIVSTGTTNSTVTYHYAGDGRSPAWTEDTAGKWTRNVYGLEGLVAIQNGGESPVLQIQDLKGDIVGTASLSETATGLLSKGDSTEYGVPRTSSPPKYSWQGGAALRTELPSGIVAMGARSYVPEIGRFLQPDPIEGGSANAYAYTYGDPVNSSDPSGEFTVGTPSWVSGFLDEQAEVATEAAIQRAAEEQAAREEAEEKAREAAEEAAEAAVAAAEVAAGGASRGKSHRRGGASRAKGGGGKAVLLSKCYLGCVKGPLKLKCDTQCHERRKKERKKEERKREEEEERKRRQKEEEECGGVRASYLPGKSSVGNGLYYPSQGKHRFIFCNNDPGPGVDMPCEAFGCDGIVTWQQWPGEPADPRRPGSTWVKV